MSNNGAHGSILIIDDDVTFRGVLADHLSHRQFSVETVGAIKDGRNHLLERSFDVILLDQNLPDGDGVEFAEELLEYGESAKILLVTAFANVSRAVEAMRAGVFDYLSKPIDLKEFEIKLERALRMDELETAEQLNRYLTNRETQSSAIIGASNEILNLKSRIDEAARAYPSPVLITGETGTGKELVARAIHSLSAESQPNKLLHINCAAITEAMFETELFGHEKGALSELNRPRKGIFELAQGGTLILDEIGDIPLSVQPKLLRVLEQGLIKRVGAHVERKVRLRVIAITNRDIEKMVAQEDFRQDLYFRLAVIRINVPPLRDRKEDISLLIKHFLEEFRARPESVFPEEQLLRLKEYTWPGNVRELKNLIERFLVAGPEAVVAFGLLPHEEKLSRHVSSGFNAISEKNTAQKSSSFPTLAEIERNHIFRALKNTGNNRTAAAKLLGISRSTLKRKLSQFRSSQNQWDGEYR